MRYVPDEELLAVVEAVRAHGTKAAAARALGIPRETLREQYSMAVRRNLTGDYLGGPLPIGKELGLVTVHTTTADGRKQEWQRHVNTAGVDELLEDLADRLNDAITPLPPVDEPGHTLDELATLYSVVDLHLGQYSWGKETKESYDLDIARDTFKRTAGRLVQRSPDSAVAIVLGLGDFFHADSNEARTPGHGNPLDTDSRNAKVINMGVELMVWLIDLALQKHQTVHVRMLPGNHDPRGGDLLTLALRMRYLDNPRVVVDRDPGVHWFFQWGLTMIAATHGHETKIEQMPGVMASYQPTMWGETRWRYAFAGHWHRRVRGKDADERHGAVWEVLPALTAKDAWNRSQGHSANRVMDAITFSKSEGLVFRHSVPIV